MTDTPSKRARAWEQARMYAGFEKERGGERSFPFQIPASDEWFVLVKGVLHELNTFPTRDEAVGYLGFLARSETINALLSSSRVDREMNGYDGGS